MKYVFVQDDPFYLPMVLDKYLREFGNSTLGINVQRTVIGNRTRFQTAWTLLRLYGPYYFQWKLRRYIAARFKETIFNRLLGSTARCHSVRAVGRKYSVPIHESNNVNSSEFRAFLREKGVELIVSISGTQFYGKDLRDQTRCGIINCHGALLPKYRGLMPSFWTLVNNEQRGGVTVHYVDGKLDNGSIIVQHHFRIRSCDTLEAVMQRSKDLAAEAIIEAVRLIEADKVNPLPNPEEESTTFSVPSVTDARRLRTNGHRFF
jgi:methionyl-tRNA formyltransferase